MEKMLRDQNPGLSRRFNPAYALHFEDFSDSELLQILSSACLNLEIQAPITVKVAAVKHLSKRRALPNFGNAGAVMNLLSDAKQKMDTRCRREKLDPKDARLTVEDVCGDKDPITTNPLAALDDLADLGGFKEQLREIGKIIKVMRAEGEDTRGLVGNFIFMGNPGTGKTTVARKLATILHAYGLMATDHVGTFVVLVAQID